MRERVCEVLEELGPLADGLSDLGKHCLEKRPRQFLKYLKQKGTSAGQVPGMI